MLDIPLVISMPVAHRPTSMAFYRDVLGDEPIGQPGEDGIPEPLRFELRPGVRLRSTPSPSAPVTPAPASSPRPGSSRGGKLPASSPTPTATPGWW